MTNNFLLTYNENPEKSISVENDFSYSFAGKKFQLHIKNFNCNDFLNHKNISVWVLRSSSNLDNKNYTSDVLQAYLRGEAPSLNSGYIIYDESKQVLCLSSDYNGFIPVFYTRTRKSIYIFSSIKDVNRCYLFSLKMINLNEFLNRRHLAKGRSVFENIYRLNRGAFLNFDLGNYELESVSKTIDKTNKFDSYSTKDLEGALFSELSDFLVRNASNRKSIAVSLSGGYDSGSIAGILSKNDISYSSITIGSEKCNEFEEANKTAKHLNVKNEQVLIKKEDYIDYYLEGVYLNELFDSMIAEGYVVWYKKYQAIKDWATCVFTGYGADMVLNNLGSMMARDNSIDDYLDKTAISGEINTGIQDSFGISTFYPYLNLKVMEICKEAGLKYNYTNISKYVQRNMIGRHQLIPRDLLDIKKKMIHTGAGIPDMFSSLINVKPKDAYKVKQRFLYEAIQAIFVKGIEVSSIDKEKLIQLSKL